MQAELALADGPAPTLTASLGRLIRTPRSLGSALLLAGSRGLAVVLQFLTQLAVASVGGAAGVGMLQLLGSWICIAGEAIALGLPVRAMRETAVDYANGNAARTRIMLIQARQSILRAWLIVAAFLALAGGIATLAGFSAVESRYTLVMAASLLGAPLFALLRLYAESLKAAGGAVAAVSLESLTSPVAILLLCALCWLMKLPLLSIHLLLAYLLSLAVAPVAMRLAIGIRLRALVAKREVCSVRRAAPKGDLLFLWGTGMLSICFVQLPFLVLPWFATEAEIGVFALAHKLVNIITTLLLLLAAVYGPRFAQQFAAGETGKLRHSLAETQLISTGIFVPAALALLALSPSLPALFGSEFNMITGFLLMLVAGQLINAITGLSGVLLTMAGQARSELACLAVALVTVVVGSLWVGPAYGAQGLAALFSIGIAIKNFGSWLTARRLLKTLEIPS